VSNGRRVGDWLGLPLLLGVGLGIALTLAARAESTAQRDAPTVRFYSPDGKGAGAASMYGNTTKFYASDGRLVGSAVRANSGRR
jgi:hypothetical protein